MLLTILFASPNGKIRYLEGSAPNDAESKRLHLLTGF